jgi:uncharacterized protein
MDWKSVIDKYYTENNALKHILLAHSQSVAHKALQIVLSHPELHADARFIEEAAMLHDIGIIRCDAPGIECQGTEPYICHGILGAEMLRELGYERHARVCERHTGAGISLDEIIRQNLPLPHHDFLPETIEEKIICYADKFYSKTHLDRERTVEQALQSLQKHGADGALRFRQWADMFE